MENTSGVDQERSTAKTALAPPSTYPPDCQVTLQFEPYSGGCWHLVAIEREPLTIRFLVRPDDMLVPVIGDSKAFVGVDIIGPNRTHRVARPSCKDGVSFTYMHDVTVPASLIDRAQSGDLARDLAVDRSRSTP